MKEEITSEIRNLLAESQREMLRLLKPETRENVREIKGEETENETGSFCTPTKSVIIISTQNNDTNVSRNSRPIRSRCFQAALVGHTHSILANQSVAEAHEVISRIVGGTYTQSV